jgi:replicative DNA helicase
MASKYVDNTSIVQVLGCIYNDPSILDAADTYPISEDDFPDEFHRIIMGSLFKLHENGAADFTLEAINDYLENHQKAKATYDVHRGNEYLTKISEVAMRSTFDYYYKRMRKMTLLRMYDNLGMDVSWLYDPDNVLDTKKKEAQEEWFDNVTLAEIADKIDQKLEIVRSKYVNNDDGAGSFKAGDGIEELIQEFETCPDVGVSLYGNYINTITRGARLGKFYLRSAPTGVGKTRSMIADACYIGCDWFYDEEFGWRKNGIAFPTLFIGTEQDKAEIQTMMLAFLSNVNEEHILTAHYENDERERVMRAAKVIKESPLYIEVLPEFNLQDVENTIKRNLREKNIQYVFHDYIHTSIKILEEISRRAGKVTLREDNILFLLSAKIKDICVKENVFIMSATQLNGDYQDSKTPDQNLLRGAKAIADKIDYGSILLPVKEQDLGSLETILNKNPQFPVPKIKLSIYKNRRGRYKSVILWCDADLGTCRIKPMFMTDFQYEWIGIEDFKVIVNEFSAFEEEE